MARIDAHFEQPLLETHRAPDVAARRRELGLRRPIDIAVLEVAEENVSLQRFARLLDELGDALEAQPERVGENLIERVAPDRIVGSLR